MAARKTHDSRREQLGGSSGCGTLGGQLQKMNGPDSASTLLPGPNRTRLGKKGGLAMPQLNGPCLTSGTRYPHRSAHVSLTTRPGAA